MLSFLHEFLKAWAFEEFTNYAGVIFYEFVPDHPRPIAID